MPASSRSRTEAWIADVQCTTQLRGAKRAHSSSPQAANKRRTPCNSSANANIPITAGSFAPAMAPKHNLTPSPSSHGGKALKPVDSVSNVEASTTPTKSSKKSDPVPDNNRSERNALAKELMFFNDKASFNKFERFKDMVSGVLVERGSEMSVRSLNLIQGYQDTNAAINEDTYFKGALDLYVKPSRTVTITKPDETVEQMVRSFSDDRLQQTYKSTFVKNMLPTTVKNSAMKDSVPDFVFGIREPYFDRRKPKISAFAEKLVKVSGTVPHCFFVIEGKGADEPYADAETQAIRSGAVLVNARRLLIGRAGILGQSKVLGPDFDSYVYTCAWMPPFARIFVNWCQVEEEVISYHINHLKSYKLDDPDDIKSFRDTIHSIFDWGLGQERVQKIEDLVRAVESNESNGR